MRTVSKAAFEPFGAVQPTTQAGSSLDFEARIPAFADGTIPPPKQSMLTFARGFGEDSARSWASYGFAEAPFSRQKPG
jgi:hypothetical protein